MTALTVPQARRVLEDLLGSETQIVRLTFSKESEVTAARQKINSVKASYRRDSKKRLDPDHELWGKSPWDHMDMVSNGNTLILRLDPVLPDDIQVEFLSEEDLSL